MSHLTLAPDRVTAALGAASIRATTDPRNVNPPTVWVELDTADRQTACRVACVVAATMIVPGPANGDALRALDALADAVGPALDAAGLPWTSSTLGTTVHPATGEALPSLTYRIPVTVTERTPTP